MIFPGAYWIEKDYGPEPDEDACEGEYGIEGTGESAWRDLDVTELDGPNRIIERKDRPG